MMLSTSIMYQISAEELTGVAWYIQSFTFRSFEVYLVVAVLYVAMTSLMRAVLSGAGLLASSRFRHLRTPFEAFMLGLTTQQMVFILQGAGWTMVLSLLGFVGGSMLGLPLALSLTGKSTAARVVTGFGINLVQGIPLPILMFAVYFGASITRYDPPTLIAAGMAIAIYSAAFLAEIWKGSIRAVPQAQWEAADCLALTSFDTLRLVIFPQAVQIATPPTIGFFVQVVKNTSTRCTCLHGADLLGACRE